MDETELLHYLFDRKMREISLSSRSAQAIMSHLLSTYGINTSGAVILVDALYAQVWDA